MSDIDPTGTHLQGYVNTTYVRLVATFGEPNAEGDNYKVQAEWNLLTDAGDVVTIYDYKEGDCYLGEGEGIPAEDVTDWHIGGHTPTVVSWVEARLDESQGIKMPSITLNEDVMIGELQTIPGLGSIRVRANEHGSVVKIGGRYHQFTDPADLRAFAADLHVFAANLLAAADVIEG
jgi:hypothetical protein